MSFIPINNQKQVGSFFKPINNIHASYITRSLIQLYERKQVARSLTQPSVSKTMGLIIGCEYIQYADQGVMDRLPGCFNDTITMNNILTKRLLVPSNNITIMRDDLAQSSSLYPSKSNIQAQLANIITRANKKEFDTLWITYSGHGSQVKASNAGEPNGKNSVIVPADFIDSGFISDNYIATQFLSKLPSDLNVNIVFDCCNSGTAVDLPYTYSSPRSVAVRENDNKISANVCYISGCRDDQTSESVTVSKGLDFGKRKTIIQSHPGTRDLIWRGALTCAFEAVLSNYGISPLVKIGLDIIFAAIQVFLIKKGYNQSPEVSLSKDLDLRSIKYPLSK